MNMDIPNSISKPQSKYKLVFLGDTGVGKTSILNRFMFDTFDGKNHPTVGIDFIQKTLFSEDKMIRLQFWDTAGQERFRSLIPSYIRDCSVAIVCYDITRKSTFDNINNWIEDVRAEREQDVIVCLVGSKSDLENQRVIQQSEGMKKAKQLDARFFEVSALSGDNVQFLFSKIVNLLLGAEASQMAHNQSASIMSKGSNQNQDEKNGIIVLNNNKDDTNENGQEGDKKINKKYNCC